MSQSEPAKSRPAKASRAEAADAAVETIEGTAVVVETAPAAAKAEATAEPTAARVPPILDKAALKANADRILDTVRKAQGRSTEAVKKAQAYSAEAVKKARTYNRNNVDALMASAAAANKGAWALRLQSFMFPQMLLTEAAAATLKLTSARSAKDLAGVYGAYAASLAKLHLSEVDKASATLVTTLADTVKPIRERIDQTLAAAG